MSKTRTQITFGLVDVTAKSDSQLSVSDKQDFVNLNDLKEEKLEEILYGTLEKNQFALDGSRKLMPEELSGMGWWSNEMSDENGNFITPLVMEMDFTSVHSSLGLTFVFSKADDYCNKLNIKYYDTNGDMISNVNFFPNSYKFVCNNIVENYAKIVITFYSTNNPYRYIKLYQILYGAEKIFEGENLMSGSLIEEVDLLSSEVTINTLDFTVYSEDDDFNIINPKGIFKLLQEKQKLKVTEFIKDEEIDMGTLYLSEWKNKEYKTMQFKAQDLIGVIDSTDFNGGMYTNVLFGNLIGEIMQSAGVGEDNYEIEECLKNIKITGYIPICSHRAALQKAIFTVGAIADCSRSDKIRIYTIPNELKSTIYMENKSDSSQEVLQNELVTGVEVTSHNYVEGTKLEELVKQELDVGNNKIIFNDPVHNISCTGGTIIEYNCNYAIINCSTATEVTINGYKYVDNQIIYKAEKELSSGEKENILKVQNVCLINKSIATSIANRILNYYQGTYKISLENILTSSEKVGNYTGLESTYEQKLAGNIIKQDIDLTGGFISKTEMIAEVVSE